MEYNTAEGQHDVCLPSSCDGRDFKVNSGVIPKITEAVFPNHRLLPPLSS